MRKTRIGKFRHNSGLEVSAICLDTEAAITEARLWIEAEGHTVRCPLRLVGNESAVVFRGMAGPRGSTEATFGDWLGLRPTGEFVVIPPDVLTQDFVRVLSTKAGV